MIRDYAVRDYIAVLTPQEYFEGIDGPAAVLEVLGLSASSTDEEVAAAAEAESLRPRCHCSEDVEEVAIRDYLLELRDEVACDDDDGGGTKS